MTSLSAGPFQRVERRSGLVLGTTLSEHRGQSRLVSALRMHPGWIYKEYNDDARRQVDDARLDRLIAFPADLPATEREILTTAASWPAARVVADDGTVGVILPLAPDVFRADVRVSRGTRSELLTIGLLAQDDAALERRGIAPQPLVNRVRLCLSIVTTAALLERHGIVYLDWSFVNAFWSPHALTTYLIDMDGCSFGPRPLIETHGWNDPLVPLGAAGGQAVDRYRVALLVGRCLTGERMAPDLPAALDRLVAAEPRLGSVCRTIRAALDASRADDRPPVAALAAALRTAAGVSDVAGGNGAGRPGGNGANVAAWVPVGQRRVRPTPVPAPRRTSEPPRRTPPATSEPDLPKPWVVPPPERPAEPALPAAAAVGLALLGALLAIVVLIILISTL